MEINGPLKIRVVEQPEGVDWELLVDFREEFRALDLHQQGEVFRHYLVELSQSAAALPQSDPNLQGVLLVQQLAEQLFPHIETGELALNETISVQIAQSAATVSLSELVKLNSL